MDYNINLSRFQPLNHILTFDIFSTGYNGWMALMSNFTQAPNFDARLSIIVKHQWPPVMLSTATYRYLGTHGALSGTYSLKISTRPVVNPYDQPPQPGSIGHAIKRMSFHHFKRKRLQFEMWFAYTVEQDFVEGEEDLAGLSENSIRAFGAGFDIQERSNRYFTGFRYLNSVDGKFHKKWQYISPADVSDMEWAYGTEGDWCKRGVDPMWYGRRYADGQHEGFKDVPGGNQHLCYNETDCKINWLYFRMLIDTEKREYIELQAQDQIFDMRNLPITLLDPYKRIDGLMNPLVWVENDARRRVFFYIDSIVISQE
jgi:hypothetical protein